MTWVRLDDGFPEHPKIDAAGGDAAWLHVCALAYCNRALTDGFVAAERIGRLSDRKSPRRLAARLVEVGLWRPVDGGYEIHDYHDYQPTRAEVLAEQAVRHDAKAKAGRAGGIASGVARRKHERSRDEADVKQNGSRDPSKTKPRPVPSPSSSSSLTTSTVIGPSASVEEDHESDGRIGRAAYVRAIGDGRA